MKHINFQNKYYENILMISVLLIISYIVSIEMNSILLLIPFMMFTRHDEKQMEKLLNNSIEHQHEIEEKKGNYKKSNLSTIENLLGAALYIYGLYYVLIEQEGLGLTNIIADLFNGLFEAIGYPETILGMTGGSYTGILILTLLFITYSTFLFVLPWNMIFFPMKPVERTLKYVRISLITFLAITLIPLALDPIFGDESDGDISSNNDFEAQTSSWWQTNIVNNPGLCPLLHFSNPEECRLINNKVDTVKSDRESYSITLLKPDNSYYKKEYLDNNGIPFIYEIESTQGAITVEKIECYQNSVKEENLIDSKEVNERITTNGISRKTFKCSSENIKLDKKLDENVPIYPVLYLSIDTKYTIQIPIIDFDRYMINNNLGEDVNPYDVNDEIVSKYGEGDITQSNNALKESLSTTSTFPVYLTSNDESNSNFELALTLEENDGTTFGDLIESTLVKITPPSKLEMTTDLVTEQKLDTFKEKSTLRFVMDSSGTDIEQEHINDILSIDINSKFKKQGKITFAIEDENYVDPSEEGASSEEIETNPLETS